MNRREFFSRAAGLAAAVGLTSKVGKAEAPPAPKLNGPRTASISIDEAEATSGVPRIFPKQTRPLLYLEPPRFGRDNARAWLIEDHRQRAQVYISNSGDLFEDCEKALRLALERHGWPVDQEADLYCCATGLGQAVALKLRLRGFPVRQVIMPPIGCAFDAADTSWSVEAPLDHDALFVHRGNRWIPLEEYAASLRWVGADFGRPGGDRTVEVRVQDGRVLEIIERGSASVGFYPRKP